MMSELVLQHFQQPQHVGELEAAANVLRVEVNSPNTGRHVVFTIQVEDRMVTQTRYQVRGCPYTIATFSYVAVWCQHRDIMELAALNRQTLIQSLELPATKVHCAAMAEDVLMQLQRKWETVC